MKKVVTFLIVSLLLQGLYSNAQETIFTQQQIDSAKTNFNSLPESTKRELFGSGQKLLGIEITGTIDDLCKQFKAKGWSIMNEEYSGPDSVIPSMRDNYILEGGYFRKYPATIALKAVSQYNRWVYYAALSFEVDEYKVQDFIEYTFRPLLEEYEAKYGEAELVKVDPKYQNSTENTSKYSYGASRTIMAFSINAVPIHIRAQTNSDNAFAIVIHYINLLGFMEADNTADDI